MTHVSSSLLKLCFDNNQAKKIVVVFLKIQNLPILSVNKMLDRIVKTKGFALKGARCGQCFLIHFGAHEIFGEMIMIISTISTLPTSSKSTLNMDKCTLTNSKCVNLYRKSLCNYLW